MATVGKRVDRSWIEVTSTSEKPSVVEFYEADDPVYGGNESTKLLYTHDDVEVKRYREYPTRRIRIFRVTKVVSPYMFYTEFDFGRPCRGFKDWRAAMQDFYNNDPGKELSKFEVKTSMLLKYRCYAYYDPDTQLWERVRLMKYCTVTKKGEIYIFDLNEFRIVPKSSIMELHPDFSYWSSQSFPTHLLNIQPCNDAAYWSKEAVNYFRKLVEGKTFNTVVITRTPAPFPEGFPDVIEFFGVCMIQRNPAKNITLQGEMVKAGFAESTGNLSGFVDIMKSGGGQMGRFDLQSFSKQPNTAFATEGNYSPVQTPSSGEVREMLGEVITKAEMLRQLQASEVKKTPYEFSPDMMPRQVAPGGNYCHLPEVYKQGLCEIRFSHMSTPSNLYIQLENYVDELREMETALGIVVENGEHIPFERAVCGLPIACLLQVDRFRAPVWVRAIVRHRLPGVQLLKVIIVDYGSDISIKTDFSRHLPKYFQEIPSFAFRIHLDSPMLVPSGGLRWSGGACESFRKYMAIWNQRSPIYYAWMPESATNVVLEDFNQELQWNPLVHRWEPAESFSGPLNVVINSMAENVLLRNFYTSVGVEVVYEIFSTNDSADYTFESLGNVLNDCGLARRLMPMKSMLGQHHSIVSAITNDDYVAHQKAILANSDEDTDKPKRVQFKAFP